MGSSPWNWCGAWTSSPSVRPRGAACNWDRLRAALRQLAAGIQALHFSALLHRDLKPSNILVTADGQVVILDFGLVKVFEPLSIEHSVSLAGSPAYMAPEQAAGGAITEAADWYAVGVILYKAISGQLPFIGTWAENTESGKQRRDCSSQSRSRS